jgi:hypothetical protein
MGTKPKFWLFRREPRPEQLWLFKYNRPGTGEDWSEKIAAEVAELLGVPHARVELASYRESPGIVALDFTDRGRYGQLVHGNELLAEIRPDYPRDRRYRVSQHTIASIIRILSRPFVHLPQPERCPRPLPREVTDAPGLFAGYLLLDALIGNTDRHHENWGILARPAPRQKAFHWELAPSFDHASSLSRELREDERAKRLATADRNYTVEAYADRARSALYGKEADKKALYALDAFVRCAELRPGVLGAWVDRVGDLGDDATAAVVGAVPGERMSDTAKEFARRLLQYNRKRILECRLSR